MNNLRASGIALLEHSVNSEGSEILGELVVALATLIVDLPLGEVHVIERSTQIQPGAAAKYGRFAFALQPLDLTTCVNLELRGGIRLKYVH